MNEEQRVAVVDSDPNEKSTNSDDKNVLISGSSNGNGDISKIVPIFNSNGGSWSGNSGNTKKKIAAITDDTTDRNNFDSVNTVTESAMDFSVNGNNNNLNHSLSSKFANKDGRVHVVDADVHENSAATSNGQTAHAVLVNINGNCDHRSAFKKSITNHGGNRYVDRSVCRNSASKFSFKKASNKVSVLVHRHTL